LVFNLKDEHKAEGDQEQSAENILTSDKVKRWQRNCTVSSSKIWTHHQILLELSNHRWWDGCNLQHA